LLLQGLEGVIDAAGGEKVGWRLGAGRDGEREGYRGQQEFHATRSFANAEVQCGDLSG
jgi:hypothetical protein